MVGIATETTAAETRVKAKVRISSAKAKVKVKAMAKDRNQAETKTRHNSSRGNKGAISKIKAQLHKTSQLKTVARITRRTR